MSRHGAIGEVQVGKVQSHRPSLTTRLAIGLAVAIVGVSAMSSAASAAPKPGSQTTLHLFSKHTGASYFNPDGTNIPNGTALEPGDFYTFTDADYVGNHRHHAKK